MQRCKSGLAVLLVFVLLVPISGSTADYEEWYGDSATVGGPSKDGVEIQIDLPASQHVRNFGAPANGLGLCVFASMTMDAHWHNVRELSDLMYWDENGKPHSKIRRGGGWPDKVDQVIKQYAPDLKYVQYQGTDLAILDKALSEGRPACVTYGFGERYRPLRTIHHMVLLVHLDSTTAVILDNNFPGTYEWMSREEFKRRWVHPGGQGWAYVMLAPPPPPVPHN